MDSDHPIGWDRNQSSCIYSVTLNATKGLNSYLTIWNYSCENEQHKYNLAKWQLCVANSNFFLKNPQYMCMYCTSVYDKKCKRHFMQGVRFLVSLLLKANLCKCGGMYFSLHVHVLVNISINWIYICIKCMSWWVLRLHFYFVFKSSVIMIISFSAIQTN